MFLQIDDLLTPDEVKTIAELARQAQFIDGRATNPHNTTKVNAMAAPGDAAAARASQITQKAIDRNEEVTGFVMPVRMATPTLCRYGVGMKYGAHIDAAFLPFNTPPLRTDVSCTVFISAPSDYVGGELVSHIGTAPIAVKGKPGSAVFYPSTTLHEVRPVTSGERLVVLTFIESVIREQLQRELIYTLDEVRALEGLKMDWRNRVRMSYVIENLKRMWSV